MSNVLEQSLLRGLPKGEAASFFVRLKTAGWEEPPDEQGLLEGQFAVPIEQVVHKLKEVIAIRSRKMLAYYTYSQSLRGEMWRAVKTEFYEHAEDEQKALEFYLKRAAVLGGGPIQTDEVEALPASSQPLDIFKMMARAEQESIACQRELRAMVGEENPMKAGIEEHMLQDQHHLDEMWQMLPQGFSAAPAVEQPMPGLEEAEEEDPEDGEKEASAIQKAKGIKRVGQLLTGSRAKALVGATKSRQGSTLRALRATDSSFAKGHEANQAFKRLDEGKAPLPWLRKANEKGKKHLDSASKSLQVAKDRMPAIQRHAREAGREVGKVTATRVGVGTGLAAAAAATASRDTSKKKKASADAEAKEKGRERAVANLSAEAHREKGRRGERVGGTLGALAGTLGGAAFGGKHLKGPSGKAVGAGLGYLLGGKAGKELGTEADIHKNASARFSQALSKLGFDGMSPQATMPEALPQPMQAPPELESQDPQMTAHQYQPTNYLMAEQVAREAEQQNEASYYRQRMQEAVSQMQGMNQQFQQAQAQLSSLEQQSAEAMNQIGERTQQAVEANQVATQHAQEAANLRIGLEKMRQQMMDVAAQDPEMLAQPAMMDPTGMEAGMDPNMGAGPAGEAAVPGQDPGTAAPGGGMPGDEAQAASGESGSVVDETAQQAQAKVGGVADTVTKHAPWALAGAGIGAASGLMSANKAPGLRSKAEELTASRQPGDYEQANQLAKTYAQLGKAEEAEKSPVRAAIGGGLGGAVLLGAAGPRIPTAAKSLVQNLRQLAQ